MNRNLWIFSCILILAGIFLLGGGIGCRIYRNYKEPLKGRTTGRVVDLLLQEPKQRPVGFSYKNLYYPVLEYYAEGKLYKVIYPVGAYPSPFRINQEIPLKYDKSDPEQYQIEETSPHRQAAELLYAAGVFCIGAGAVLFVAFALRRR